jgi:2-oxoglutarate dehydrogenase E2 component (dihydrolipoamide succinyltransferase)
MPLEVKIPAVGESITSGLISTWHKKDGETVAAGDVLFTLETDKVSTEITAESAGVLRIKATEGTEVKIGEVVATIEEAGASGTAAKQSEPAATPPAEVAPPRSTGRVETPATPEPPPQAEGIGDEQKSTAIQIPEAGQAVPEQRAAAQAPAAQAGSESRFERRKMSPLRRKIAAQLVMAQHTAAILTTFNECDMSAVMSFRKRMQEDFQKEHGVKLGFMSFFIKATVAALKACPAINGRIDGDDFIQNHFYDIGVAVGTERGLVVPVLRDADKKSFPEIERDLLTYAGKAREGKIKIEDLQGGVFTISNGGVYGSLLSTPILNPPQSGILGMHKIQERPVALNGQVVIRPMMYLALSYDHRIVDGKDAVTFLVRVKECIEEPMRLLLEA